MLSQILLSALLLSGVEGQYRSKRHRVVDGNALPPLAFRRLGSHSNSSNATSNATEATVTEAPVTEAPVTEAPATEAPVTEAPTAAVTEAPTPAVTEAPTAAVTEAAAVTQAATEAATSAATTEPATTSALQGNQTAEPEAKVETQVSMTMSIDLTDFGTNEKKALGNALAYGLHSATCDGVAAMWDTKVECFLGNSNIEGVKFGFVPEINSALGEIDGCTSAAECYGDEAVTAAARVLQAQELTNKATFEVKAKGAAVIAQAQTAKAALDSAEAAGTFSVDAIATEVAAAMARPALNSTLGAKVAAITTSVKAATVTVTVEAVQGDTPAPASGSTSDASYTAGITGAFGLLAGVLLF